MSSTSSKTSFSSFKSPRPAPSPPTSLFKHSSLKKMISDSCISVKGLRLHSDDGLTHDPYVYHASFGVVRREYVGVQRDRLRSWSWTRRMWLALDNNWLYICQREDSVATQTLPLKHVRLLEQVQCKRYCLVVATSSLTWYLFFKDTISLHAWLHDIRNRCPLMKIGLPTNFRHEMHVTYDAAASEITGLPDAWIETLSSWGMGPRLSSTFSLIQPDIPSPITEPSTSPVIASTTEPSDSDARPLVHERAPHVGRQRSASAAVAPSIAPSIAPSVDQFRRSPNRFRDVDARDLTGAVQPVTLFPTARTENCDVWKAQWSGSFGKRKVAIQVIRLSGIVSEGEQTQLSSIVLREIKALHQLRHPNVVRTRGFCRDQGPVPAFVSTWLPRGNLMKYLEYHRPSIGKGPRLKFITEVAAGMNYLHNFSRMIVHGDLRGAHILLSDGGNACISGFGLNPILQEMESHSVDGDPFVMMPSSPSPRWAAIEVIRMGRRRVSSFGDIFSFARTVLEIMTGKDPFHYIADDVDVGHAVLRGVLPRRPLVFGEGDGLWQFLERCWVEDPVKRPSMALTLLRMENIHCLYHDPDKEEPPGSA